MVAFVGQWWTESRKPPTVETVASHIAALAWMGLRHLPRRPAAGQRRGGIVTARVSRFTAVDPKWDRGAVARGVRDRGPSVSTGMAI